MQPPNHGETALYPPVKAFLQRLGFEVKGELRGCDVVAVRPGEPPLLVIAELKLGLSFELILQAVDRLRTADEVWIAVPATRRGRDRDPRAHMLCRRLGIGLLAVGLSRAGVKTQAGVETRAGVEILAEPGPYDPRRHQRKRGLLLQEFARRRGDPAVGGSTRTAIMTAYRQQALDCAAAMAAGPLRPRDLRAHAPDAAKILQRNYYGWFERVQTGLYRLTPPGESALLHWTPPPGQSP